VKRNKFVSKSLTNTIEKKVAFSLNVGCSQLSIIAVFYVCLLTNLYVW